MHDHSRREWIARVFLSPREGPYWPAFGGDGQRPFSLRNISQSPNFCPVLPRDDVSQREMGEGYALLTVGITFAVTLTLFVLAGIWADRRWRTTPWLTVAGTLVGMSVGGFWMYQRVLRQTKQDDARG